MLRRWADLEEQKDKEFEAREAAQWRLAGTAPVRRKRIRSPPPDEQGDGYKQQVFFYES